MYEAPLSTHKKRKMLKKSNNKYKYNIKKLIPQIYKKNKNGQLKFDPEKKDKSIF